MNRFCQADFQKGWRNQRGLLPMGFWKCGVLLFFVGALPAHSAEPAFSEQQAGQFLRQHCQECHSGAKPEGKFAADRLGANFAVKADRLWWSKVAQQLQAGNMPPPEQPRPEQPQQRALLEWIAQQTAAAQTAEQAAQGRVVLRRLNRVEYKNTIRDLLGVEVELDDLLPLDATTGGFDNNAQSLHVSSHLMENYLQAADRALDAAIANAPRPATIKKRYSIKDERTIKPTGSVYRYLDDGVAIFSSWVSANIQVTLWQFRTLERGRYRFRISGYAYQTEKPVVFHVKAGPLNAAAEQYLIDYFEMPPGQPSVVEFAAPMEAQKTIRIVTDQLNIIPPEVQKIGADKYQGAGLVVQWVEIEGPLYDGWPPPSHRLLWGDLPQRMTPLPDNSRRWEVVSAQPLADAHRLLTDFARRAFRRPVSDDDIRPFVERVRQRLAQHDSFEQAMRVGFQAVLVSPHFLYLHEAPRSGSQALAANSRPGTAGIALDQFALASRLSYFLWSAPPDQELFALAEQSRLRDPEILRVQVERMLSDAKAKAFTENFVGQWLGLRAIDSTVPDRLLYPEYDDVLRSAMLSEVYRFFDEVLTHDLSLTNFVHSDFSMLNGQLAKLYGIPGVEGLEFRKVSLPPDSHRGGVMTMAGVLKVTANGTTTSPILRGSWVLDRILGTPPPKPTVDVEAIEPDIRGATTIREQLAKHRQEAACATCHRSIDPPGFALENFDVIGGWREHYRSIGDGEPVVLNGRRVRYRLGPPVDAADTLPDGRSFRNIDEYKQLLLENPDQLARALTEKLLAYGTGAEATAADRLHVDQIVERVRPRQYGFRSLIHELVQSDLFQQK